MTEKPRAEVQGLTPILKVADIKASIKHYTQVLGFEEVWDYGDFACVRRDKSDVFFATDQGALGTWVCILVTDANALHEEIAPRGAKVVMPLTDMDHGMREFVVQDPDGHTIRFGHVIYPKNFKVTRTTLEVRLEERMAKVLEDVARATNRTVGETLEETLLHTFYNVGPHTDGTLKLIEDLKQKHGLDYDVHANYNFTEE
jgi:uncharacterized glyoxalase superfamily protein PhnB